jgi:hypothetical protein
MKRNTLHARRRKARVKFLRFRGPLKKAVSEIIHANAPCGGNKSAEDLELLLS